MKKTVFSYLSILTAALLFGACKHGTIFTPKSSGRAYEMLVVVDKDLWQRPAGRALFDVLDTDVPGLPQSERSFRISNVAPDDFDRTFRIFRNIIVVDIKPTYTQGKLKYVRNAYAQPQMIMNIQAPDEEEFRQFVTRNRQTILNFFVSAEMNRQISALKEKHSDLVERKVDSIFHCKVWVPTELAFYKVGKDFFWGSTNSATSDMNIVVYSYPYTDTRTFTRDYYIHKRDSVMERNLPGAREGMYMMTDTLYVETQDIAVRGDYAQEARGLWAMKGDMMGGPFVAHSRVDKANGRVVVVEAFIYSPDKLKRNLMRMMEASLYTLTLPDEEQAGELPVEGAEETPAEKQSEKN